jgi:hypothetical protein
MTVEFNPQGAWRAYVKGDIGIQLRWVNGEPAMVMFPLRRKDGVGAFVVCLSALHKYTDDWYLIDQAVKAAEVMGMGRDKSTIYRIADAINDAIIDLCRMPPEPVREEKVNYNISMNDDRIKLEVEA